MSRNSLLEAGAKSEGEVTAAGLEPRSNSIKFNSFLRSCKIFKVKPKKFPKTNPQSHCPILLLALLSKIIERIVYDQTDVFE